MEDYESDYRDPPSPVDPLLKAAVVAYHELATWTEDPNADENLWEAIDQLSAAINAKGVKGYNV